MPVRTYPEFPGFCEVAHPLIRDKLGQLRNKNTESRLFRDLLKEITILLIYEATADLQLEKIQIETPVETMEAEKYPGKGPVVLPVLRAGLGMVDPFLTVIPQSSIGHVGLYRDEATFSPVEYYFKIPPDSSDREIFITDPMLATGGSASEVISRLKERNIKRIRFLCIIAAPEGVSRMLSVHPDVPIYSASLDRGLNQQKFIVPGLGDAGDRLFGTVI